MNFRIKELRKAMNLNQEKFGKLLGITKSGVSDIESGRRKVTEQHIIMLKNYNVNENWLRTGEGEMFLSSNRTSEIAKLTNQLLSEESDSFKNRFINMLANLTVDEWRFLEKKAQQLVEPSIVSDNNGQMTYDFDNNQKTNTNKSKDKTVEELEEEYKKSLLHSVRNINSSALNTTNEKEKKKNA